MDLDSYVCEMRILQREEIVLHLFVKCNFAKACWASIGIRTPTLLPMTALIKVLKRKLDVPFYMDILILMCWSIWKTRHEWIFNNVDPTVQNAEINSFKSSRWCYIKPNQAKLIVFGNRYGIPVILFFCPFSVYFPFVNKLFLGRQVPGY